MKKFSQKTNIGIRHFRAALAVAETGSFTRAAEYLHVVPSALTETIRQLETDSGVSLFDRSERPIVPTQGGAELVEHARRVVADFDTAILEMRRLGGLARGAVRIGAAPSMVPPLSPAIARFRADHPGIEVTVVDDIAGRLGTLVLEGAIDFALAERWHDTDDLSYQPLLNDPFVLVCPATNPLARRAAVALDDIAETDMIMLAGNTGIGKMLAAEGILPPRLRNVGLRAHSTIALLIMIAQGMGLTLMPRLAASVLQSPDIVQVPLLDLALERQLCIVRRARTGITPAADALLSHVRTSLLQQETYQPERSKRGARPKRSR